MPILPDMGVREKCNNKKEKLFQFSVDLTVLVKRRLYFSRDLYIKKN